MKIRHLLALLLYRIIAGKQYAQNIHLLLKEDEQPIKKQVNTAQQKRTNTYKAKRTELGFRYNNGVLYAIDMLKTGEETPNTRFKITDYKVGADSYFSTGTRIISQIIKVYSITNKAIMEDSKGWF